MYTFLHKKKINFPSNFFSKFVRCTPLIVYLTWNTHTSKQSIGFFSTSLAHFVWTFLQWHPITTQNLQT